MMAFHYFLLPHCYGSESSGADLEISRRGSVHACAYAAWHTWDVGWWTRGAGSPPWLKPWQQHPGEYRQESCGKLQLQGDVHHITPKGRAVMSRSPQSALLRPGLPWDRSFWGDTSTSITSTHLSWHQGHGAGVSLRSQPSMTPVCM